MRNFLSFHLFFINVTKIEFILPNFLYQNTIVIHFVFNFLFLKIFVLSLINFFLTNKESIPSSLL